MNGQSKKEETHTAQDASLRGARRRRSEPDDRLGCLRHRPAVDQCCVRHRARVAVRQGAVRRQRPRRTLYLFKRDIGLPQHLLGRVREGRAPFLTTKAAKAGGGARASLLGTTKRTDGTVQVPYARHPCRCSAETPSPARSNFGVWLVVSPGGAPVKWQRDGRGQLPLPSANRTRAGLLATRVAAGRG